MMFYKYKRNNSSLTRKVTYKICYKLNKEASTDGVTPSVRVNLSSLMNNIL